MNLYIHNNTTADIYKLYFYIIYQNLKNKALLFTCPATTNFMPELFKTTDIINSIFHFRCAIFHMNLLIWYLYYAV